MNRPSPASSDRSVQPSPPSPSSVYVYLAGVGAVGSALLRQLDNRTNAEPDIHLVGACTSRRATWHERGLPPGAVPSRLADGTGLDWSSIVDRLTRDAPRPLVFVDATGHPEVADRYEPLLRAGVHVVTPSKLANTRSQAAFDRLQAAAAERGAQYRYETTVGAGLPVVETVRDLVATGDRLRSVRGAVSGTLTFLFSALRSGSSFSDAVQAATERGYTEPDVRDDLSGEDVARKFLILARTAGRTLERKDVRVESLVPDSLADLSYDAFLEQLPTVDAHWRERSRAAAAEDAVLQYVGRLSAEGIEVGVEPVPKDTSFGRLEGQDNLFEIVTDRYAEAPLTIRGPGAGPEVTAAGVLADVLKVARAVCPPEYDQAETEGMRPV